MIRPSGGIAAAYGLRYQYLVTVEILLELFEAEDRNWAVGVDLAAQDSADILVCTSTGNRAIQVKGSLESSSTVMSLPALRRCFDAIQTEHPGVPRATVVTNRALTTNAGAFARELDSLDDAPSRTRQDVDQRDEGLPEITQRILAVIARLRHRGAGGSSAKTNHLLLSVFLNLVGEAGSGQATQYVTRADVAALIDSSARTLAEAADERGWGAAFGVPVISAVQRPLISDFLTDALARDVAEGVPSVAVLTGLSGSGKSAAAAAWAASHRENYAFTLWLDASSNSALGDQLVRITRLFGREAAVDGEPAEVFKELLSTTPLPWLLIFDGATAYDEIRDWLPVSGYGDTIVTTTSRDWPLDVAPRMEVGVMTDLEAEALVRLRLSATPESPDVPSAEISKFTEYVGAWPLGLDLACAWVRSLGGDLSHLDEFVARLHRMPLMDEDFNDNSYPRSLVAIVTELWDGLAWGSQLVLSMVIISGGTRIPVEIVRRWASATLEGYERAPVVAPDAIRELTRNALVRVQVTPGAATSEFDEVLVVHEGLQAFIWNTGVVATAGDIRLWLEAYAEAFHSALEEARVEDCAIMLPGVEGFLAGFLSASPLEDEEDPVRETRLHATTLMHNVGSLTMLLGLLDTAEKWLTIALNIREATTPEEVAQRPAYRATQIQTLGMLAQVLVRKGKTDLISIVATKAMQYVGGQGMDAVQSTGVHAAQLLDVIRQALKVTPLDPQERELLARYDDLLCDFTLSGLSETAMDAHLNWFRNITGEAEELAESEQWSAAVDKAVTAAEHAICKGILHHDATEAVLDTAALLLYGAMRRQHEWPAQSWQDAITRLAQWCETTSDSFNESQAFRADIVIATASLDPDRIEQAAVTQSPEDMSVQTAAWAAMGDAIAAMLRATARVRDLFPHTTDAVILHRTINGGGTNNWWHTHDGNGAPILLFVTDSATTYIQGTWTDALIPMLIDAGFPDHLDETGRPQPAVGWNVQIRGQNLTIRSRDGRTWVDIDFDADDSPWLETVQTSGSLRVIYGDPADRTAEDVLGSPTQAMVSVKTGLRRWWKSRRHGR